MAATKSPSELLRDEHIEKMDAANAAIDAFVTAINDLKIEEVGIPSQPRQFLERLTSSALQYKNEVRSLLIQLDPARNNATSPQYTPIP